SVQSTNRSVAERMTGLVDVLVWVTDPQKYADAVIHQEFVRPFAGHDAVTVLVLNQVDRLREDERGPVLDSLAQLARAAALGRAPGRCPRCRRSPAGRGGPGRYGRTARPRRCGRPGRGPRHRRPGRTGGPGRRRLVPLPRRPEGGLAAGALGPSPAPGPAE